MDNPPHLTVVAPLELPSGAASDVVEETVRLPGRTARMPPAGVTAPPSG